MIEIKTDDRNPRITRWQMDKTTTWDDFTKSINLLSEQSTSASESFSVIATTTGQMPRGNALSHLRQLIDVVGESDMIERFIVINHKQNPIGQVFIGMALKLFAHHNKLHVVSSEEEALALI